MRVVQGKEPAQFVGIWNGSMVVYEGGVASGFKSFQEEDSDGASDSIKLFQVRTAFYRTVSNPEQCEDGNMHVTISNIFLLTHSCKVHCTTNSFSPSLSPS